jgi:hypothetical protein
MANTNAPYGFRPIRHASGGTIRQEEYSIASGYGTAIGYGHPVELTSTTNQIQIAAAANEDNLGIFVGCKYTDSNGNITYSRYWPASTTGTNIVAYVITDPFVVFSCQGDSVAVTDLGAFADWNAGTTNTTTGNSGAYLAVSGATGTTGKSMRILKIIDDGENAAGAYAKIEVMWTENTLVGPVTGVGGI